MNPPLVSIIIPIYNVERYLAQCIESILSQTFADFELLLINDGSRDNSGNICDSYASKDNRIRVFHKSNSGVSASRNLGVKEALGIWITFIDSDDWVDGDYLETLVKHTDDNVGLVVGGYTKHFLLTHEHCASEATAEYAPSDFSRFYDNFISTCMVKAVWGNLFLTSELKGKKALFAEDMSLGEDTVFKLNYIKELKRSIVVVNRSLYNWRCVNESDSLSQKSNIKGWIKFIEIFYPALINSFVELKQSVHIKTSLASDCYTLINMQFKEKEYSINSLKKVYSLLSKYKAKIDLQVFRSRGVLVLLTETVFKFSSSVLISHAILSSVFYIFALKKKFIK